MLFGTSILLIYDLYYNMLNFLVLVIRHKMLYVCIFSKCLSLFFFFFFSNTQITKQKNSPEIWFDSVNETSPALKSVNDLAMVLFY